MVAIARQWHTEHVSAATNEHAATVRELYDSQSRETVR